MASFNAVIVRTFTSGAWYQYVNGIESTWVNAIRSPDFLFGSRFEEIGCETNEF